ncbi:MAG: helix-turn-helix domain-containing protein [Schleiferiaceae bacterium]|nr:helix-turn-helix domain-containing protein [Schleiferiaceae bacterium]
MGDEVKQQLELTVEEAVARALQRHGGIPPRKWLTRQEACERLQVHQVTLRRYVNRGFIRQGGTPQNCYFSLEDIDALQAGQPRQYDPQNNLIK